MDGREIVHPLVITSKHPVFSVGFGLNLANLKAPRITVSLSDDV